MKNKISKLALAALLTVSLATPILNGCGNRSIIDTTYHFDYAIALLPNGEIIEGKVQNWHDYEDGDQIQVKIDNITYLVHSSSIVLISH